MIANTNNLLLLLGRAHTELSFTLQTYDSSGTPSLDKAAVRSLVEEINAVIVAPREGSPEAQPIRLDKDEMHRWGFMLTARLNIGRTMSEAIEDADAFIRAVRCRKETQP